jgi:hypothetical protein
LKAGDGRAKHLDLEPAASLSKHRDRSRSGHRLYDHRPGRSHAAMDPSEQPTPMRGRH